MTGAELFADMVASMNDDHCTMCRRPIAATTNEWLGHCGHPGVYCSDACLTASFNVRSGAQVFA